MRQRWAHDNAWRLPEVGEVVLHRSHCISFQVSSSDGLGRLPEVVRAAKQILGAQHFGRVFAATNEKSPGLRDAGRAISGGMGLAVAVAAECAAGDVDGAATTVNKGGDARGAPCHDPTVVGAA